MTRWMAGLTLAALLSAPVAAQTPDTIPLDVALRQALANSREVAEAEAAVRVARGQVTEAFAQALPDISASASYQRNFKVQEAFLPAVIFDPNASPDDLIPVRFGADNSWNAGIALTQRLFEYGVFVGIGAAGQYKDLEGERARGVSQQVVTGVRRAYFDVLLAQEQVRLTEQSVERVRQTLAESRSMNQAGLASDYDVLRLQVQLSNLEPNLRRARDQVRTATRQLAIAIGRNANDPIAVEGSLHDVDIEHPDANDPVNAALLRSAGGTELDSLDYSTAWDQATEQRTDLRQARLNVDLQHAQLRVQIGEYFPRVSLFSNYNIAAQENGGPNFFGNSNQRATSFNGGIRVEMPIFRGFSRGGRVAQARANLDQARVQADRAEEQAQSQLHTLMDALAETRARVASAHGAVDQAQRGFEIASAEYRAGTGSQLQITDAEVALRQSEFNYAQAVYDYLTTRSSLEAAVGVVPAGGSRE